MILLQAYLNDLKSVYIEKLKLYETDREIPIISIFNTIDVDIIKKYREKYPFYLKKYEIVSENVLLNFVKYIVDKNFIDISGVDFNNLFIYNPDMEDE